MRLLDMQTVIFGYIISNAICALVMASLWRQNRKRFAGLGFWLADFGLQLAGIALLALRGVIPDVVSMVGGNSCIIGGTILLYIGLERFVGQPGSQAHNAVLLTVFIGIHTYFTLVQPNLAARTLNLLVGLLLVCGECAWLMLRRVDAALRPITRGVGIVLGSYCVVSLIRMFIVLREPPATNFFASGTYDTLMIMLSQMLFIGLTFSLFLMLNRRLFLKLQRQQHALRVNEAKFAKAFHATPDAILITRASDGRIIEVNEGFCRLAEYTRAEALGHSTLALDVWANPPDRDRCITALRAKQSLRDQEYAFRAKSGNILHCLYAGEIIELEGESHILSVIRDITARKQADKALRESERKFRFITERTNDLIYLYRLQPEPGFEYVSPSAERITGYTPEEHYQDPQLGLKIVHPDDLPRLQAFLANDVKTTPLVLRWRKKDGSMIWTEIENIPLYNDAGELTAIQGKATDITARKQAEEALRESEERFRTVWDISVDALALSDPEGTVLAANAAYLQLYDYPEEAVIGKSFAIIFPEDKRQWAIEQYRLIFASPHVPSAFESTVQRSDGTIRIVESRIGFSSKDGQRSAMLIQGAACPWAA